MTVTPVPEKVTEVLWPCAAGGAVLKAPGLPPDPTTMLIACPVKTFTMVWVTTPPAPPPPPPFDPPPPPPPTAIISTEPDGAARYGKSGKTQLADELNTATTLLPSTKAAFTLHWGKGDAKSIARDGNAENRRKSEQANVVAE